MPTDLAPDAASSEVSRPEGAGTLDARGRRRAIVLWAAAAWFTWLYVTRIINLFSGPEQHSTGFIVVHLVLFAGSLTFSGALAAIGLSTWREAKR